MIVLISKSGEKFNISKEAGIKSKLIKELLTDYEGSELPLPDVESKTLTKVIEYLEYHKDKDFEDIPKPLVDSNIQRILNDFDYKFVKDMSLDECYELVNAANYMDIHSLLNLVSAYIASVLYDLDPETIRDKLGIENDMNEQEKKEYEIDNI